jgi:hypothetical protein
MATYREHTIIQAAKRAMGEDDQGNTDDFVRNLFNILGIDTKELRLSGEVEVDVAIKGTMTVTMESAGWLDEDLLTELEEQLAFIVEQLSVEIESHVSV